MKINLTGVPETLYVTMCARAMETIRSDAAIKDPDAVNLLERIEFGLSEPLVSSKQEFFRILFT